MLQNLIKQQFEKNKVSWVKSFISGFCQDENGDFLPWTTYQFIEFIKTKLNKEQIIFEYGSGSSTLFFAKRVKKVIALESNFDWFCFMQKKINDLELRNVELIYLDNALQNEKYENFAKEKSAEINEKFDLILIDSLKRFACARNSLQAIKPEGMVILDDSERKNYQKIFDFFAENKLTKLDFAGIAPGQLKIKNCSVFS